MASTSLKLPEDLKEKATVAAQQLGMTPHAFMVEAIRQATVAAEQRKEFLAEAKQARALMLETGAGYDAGDVRAYLERRLDQPGAERPPLKQWRD